MYLESFGLNEFPFRLTPDADFLYMSKAHARAKAYMDYTVLSRDGFVVLTGEIGSGKTTLLNKLLSELPSDVVVAKVFQTQLTELEFLQAVLGDFGVEVPLGTGKVAMLDALNVFLIDNYQQGRRVLLIVDEAQNLHEKVLEELRLLSGLETDKDKLLSIILTGQPELAAMIDSPHMEQLAQRVRLRFHLCALSVVEMREYIRHRLEVAGGSLDAIFDDDAFPIIYEYTGGIPRLINSLCDMAMLTAFADESSRVGHAVVRQAIDELGWVPFAERPGQMGRVPMLATGRLASPLAVEAIGVAQLPADAADKLSRLLEFMPRMSAGLMGKIRLIEEQLRDISQELKRKV